MADTTGITGTTRDSAPPPSVLIVTGEASGERYAAQAVQAFQAEFGPDAASFYGSGGEAMRAAGVVLLADVARLSAIGPWEALKLFGDYLGLLRRILREVRARGTRLALLVDFPDFNLILARFLRRRGITVLYYISPTVWAWRRGRMRTIRRTVRRMLCIFPFEEALYREAGIDALYVGHPLMATLPEVEPAAAFRARHGLNEPAVPIAVLPGSRHAEIRHILPPLLEALVRIKAALPEARFLVPAASGGIRRDIAAGIKAFFQADRAPLAPADIHLLDGDTTNVLANARMGIVKSGTSTLQAAIAGTPFVMIYRANPAMWLLSRIILSNRHFCIVNLIAGREVVPELLQDRLNGENLARTFLTIFTSPDIYNRMQRELTEQKDRLGSRDAPLTVARQLRDALNDTHAQTGGRP
jgi:lipid-A-disaccharide synthase